MKTRHLLQLATIAALAFVAGGCACCKESKSASKPAAPLTEEEMNKRMMAAATPGAPHKSLEVFAGNWDVASKWWMAPEAPPMESKGASSKSWVMGGRFLKEDFSGDMMGTPFTGNGLSGYDNIKKKYNSLWVDSSSTGIFTSLGTVSADGKTFTYTSKMDDCMTGEMDKPVRFVITVISKDKHTFEMYEGAGAKEKKIGEMTYSRK